MRTPGRLIATVACLLLAGGTGGAADHVVAGKKLLVRTPAAGADGNRILHLGTGPTITVGVAGGPGDPRCSGTADGGTSSLRITAGGGATDVVIPLPCSGWSTNGANSLYRYKDASGATCKLVMVKNGSLVKAVCKGTQVAVDMVTGMTPVGVVATLNTDRFCAEYGGTAVRDGSDGVTLLHQDAPAPAACASQSTSTTITSGSTSTTLACCILYAGQCTWTTTEVACILTGGVAVGNPGSVCDGISGSCLPPPARTGYCCAYPGLCTSGPTGDPLDCVEAGGTVFTNASCNPDGSCTE